MLQKHFFLILSLLALHSSLFGSTLNEQAEKAWAERAQLPQTLKAIELWQQSLKENESQPDIWIRLTEAMGRAVRRSPKKSEAKKWAERARESGAKAIEQNPSSAAAYAAYGEALGQWANTHKGLSSLKTVKQAVKSLQKAIDLNPRFGYAHMLLAEFYRKAPSSISVGDKDKALHHARLAVETEPDRAINHLAYAKALIEQGQPQAAIEQLQFIVRMTPRTDLIPETQANQEDAKAVLACLEKKKGKACAN